MKCPSVANQPAEVLIFRFAANDPSSAQANTVLLSDDEMTRAARFCFEEDRTVYINTRAQLRRILGDCLSLTPGKLRFVYNDFGKPFLHPGTPGDDWRFSVSHSRGMALVACARGVRVGVDLEAVRQDMPEEDAVVTEFFSGPEQDELRALPSSLRRRGFFCGWTRKEAFLKATGQGLSMPSRSFDVTMHPDRKPALLRCDWTPVSEWRLKHIQPCPGYVGALAVNSHDFSVGLNSTYR